MSIPETFYEQLFCTIVFGKDFLCLQFGFAIFRQKNIGVKAAHKIFLKSTPGVNSVNILQAAFFVL